MFSVLNPPASNKMIPYGRNFGFVALIFILFYFIYDNLFMIHSPNCHICPKEGGGSENLKMSPFKSVTNGMGREGPRANLDTVTKYSGFFF